MTEPTLDAIYRALAGPCERCEKLARRIFPKPLPLKLKNHYRSIARLHCCSCHLDFPTSVSYTSHPCRLETP